MSEETTGVRSKMDEDDWIDVMESEFVDIARSGIKEGDNSMTDAKNTATGGTDQFDYPVKIDTVHRATESGDYSGDRFDCAADGAYMHTGAWPTWSYCPFCGEVL